MPDRDVRTLRDLIWYQYAKIIAKSALGPEAKREHYGFVKQTLRDLQSGRKQWSDIAREDWQLVESERLLRRQKPGESSCGEAKQIEKDGECQKRFVTELHDFADTLRRAVWREHEQGWCR